MAVALALRMFAGVVMQRIVDRSATPRVCLFPDAEYYWVLARAVRQGAPFDIVEWGTIHHYALRTPGYPIFLATCQAILGERPLAVRLVQAGLGALTVWLVYRLTRQVLVSGDLEPASTGQWWSVPLIAAALAALNPYYIAMSELILSEAVFVPLMLLTLWGLAVLWRPVAEAGPKRTCSLSWHFLVTALATGVACGAAILTRPSSALFLPAALLVWVIDGFWSCEVWLRRRAFQGAVLVLVGAVLTMGPWWVRNARIYGRFVPTALWFGASLYDGLNPEATGASDMAFLADPSLRALDDQGQDALLTRRALDFARTHPRRVLELATIKFGRFWSPWPNASGYRSGIVAAASSLLVTPLYVLLFTGAWILRHDLRAWVLLAGPLLYFCAVHLVFVSSIRYRIPAEPAALGLAAIGLQSIVVRGGSPARARSPEQIPIQRSSPHG